MIKNVSNCCVPKKRFDYLLWGGIAICFFGYFLHFFTENIDILYLSKFAKNTFEQLNKMWWGILIGIIFVGLMSKIPQNFFLKILGKSGSFSGILRATLGGVLLDLCSHGILMVGMQLYKKGVSLGQVMAFLIASPWNSFSLTFILWSLIGFKWMMAFLFLSMFIGIFSGLIFDKLVKRKILPKNPNTNVLPIDFKFWKEAKKCFKDTNFSRKYFLEISQNSWRDSKMVLRWVFLGIILAGILQTFLSADNFQTFFGASLLGLGATLVVATILEVCSEGSTPIAADILTKANAPGNAFAFLMTGVSTDYTEIMSIKDTTKSWKIALFLPLITLPQVIIIAIILNLNA